MGVQADPRRQMPCRIDELGVSVSRNGTTEHGHGHGEVDEIWSDDDDSWEEALQLALVARTNKNNLQSFRSSHHRLQKAQMFRGKGAKNISVHLSSHSPPEKADRLMSEDQTKGDESRDGKGRG
jgi:hypothetical protein